MCLKLGVRESKHLKFSSGSKWERISLPHATPLCNGHYSAALQRALQDLTALCAAMLHWGSPAVVHHALG